MRPEPTMLTAELIVGGFKDLWRDLVHAARSLAKARAFTLVCVIPLGIGMTPVIAVPYWARVFTTPLRAARSATVTGAAIS